MVSVLYCLLLLLFSYHFPYQVISRGNIVTTSSFTMTSRQKTFAVLASRDMIPEATVLVYSVTDSGQVLADSISFHVCGLWRDGVSWHVLDAKLEF